MQWFVQLGTIPQRACRSMRHCCQPLTSKHGQIDNRPLVTSLISSSRAAIAFYIHLQKAAHVTQNPLSLSFLLVSIHDQFQKSWKKISHVYKKNNMTVYTLIWGNHFTSMQKWPQCKVALKLCKTVLSWHSVQLKRRPVLQGDVNHDKKERSRLCQAPSGTHLLGLSWAHPVAWSGLQPPHLLTPGTTKLGWMSIGYTVVGHNTKTYT